MSGADQAIVVTGAAGGIGSAIVRTLLARRAEHGNARVIAVDLGWGTSGVTEQSEVGAVERCTLDVSDEEAVAAFFSRVRDTALLRAVVHAAGTLHVGPAIHAPAAEVRRLFEVNALGSLWVATHAARVMLAQDAAALGVNTRSITTVASNAGNGPRAGFAAYGASKAAASAFTRSLGLEIGSAGIRCNTINPGTTRTPMVEAMWDGADRSVAAVAGDPGAYRAGVPLGRIADPADIADVVDFLVSPRARHVTLAELSVDGGATQR